MSSISVLEFPTCYCAFLMHLLKHFSVLLFVHYSLASCNQTCLRQLDKLKLFVVIKLQIFLFIIFFLTFKSTNKEPIIFNRIYAY